MPGPPLMIAMICPDFEGPVRNGGIGTANAHLAQVLAMAGHSVRVLFTQPAENDTDPEGWRTTADTSRIGITLLEGGGSPRSRRAYYPDHEDVSRAYRAYEWVLDVAPDLVVVNDWRGHGFYIAQEIDRPPVVAVTHGPSLWHDQGNAALANDRDHVLRYYLERKTVEAADAVVSPSAYMLEWLHLHGYRLPTMQYVQPNPLILESRRAKPSNPTGLAFFGRLEYRKGLTEFCDAIDLLVERKQPPTRVTFLGKFGFVGAERAAEYLARRIAPWPLEVVVHSSLDSRSALRELEESGDMAVMASLVENSPYAVMEAAIRGIPFVARDVGGIRELLDTETAGRSLFSGTANDLADALQSQLAGGVRPPRLAFQVEANNAAWSTGLPALASDLHDRPSSATRERSPSITICLVHHNRPAYLHEAVGSLLAQDDSAFDVVLIDDGSDEASRSEVRRLQPQFDDRGWRIIFTENQYLGAARNTAASASRSEYLLFMDDDNVALPSMVRTFRGVASRTGADLVTCAFDVFSESGDGDQVSAERFLPLGDSLSEGARRNVIGDANSLIRRSAFDALGGFTTDVGVGSEDYELFLRLVLSDKRVALCPRPLFQYRRHQQSMTASTHVAVNSTRAMRAFLQCWPANMYELALAARPASTVESVAQPWCEEHLLSWDADDAFVCWALMGGREDVARRAAVCQLEDTPGRLVLGLFDTVKDHGWGAATAAIRCSAWSHAVTLDAGLVVAAAHAGFDDDNRCAFVSWLLLEWSAPWPDDQRLDALACGLLVLTGTGRTVTRLAVLGVALRIASEAYVRRRPDIRQAIRDGSLPSALAHYVAWGAAEGLPWPELQPLSQAARGWTADERQELVVAASAAALPELRRFLSVVLASQHPLPLGAC
jgi:glycosyltransferase involved in cell wall biosynthesis